MSGGWKQSVVEQSAFYHHTDGKLDGMVVVYVDDIIARGHSQVVGENVQASTTMRDDTRSGDPW